MTADSKRPRLHVYPLQLGWTQQELADRLTHLAWMKHRVHVAVNADMIATWERGVTGVSTRYRELLCDLFGVIADQLGLKNTLPSAAVRAVSPGRDESLVGMLDNAAQLLDQLGTALAPHMLHAWKNAVTTRRTMLGLLDPAALMTPVAAHLRMTAAALRRDPAPEQRRRLLRNQTQVTILAGRLAADDLGNPMSGRAYYALAVDTAREAGDDHLTALAHGHAEKFRA